jgi:hypothetical protein
MPTRQCVGIFVYLLAKNPIGQVSKRIISVLEVLGEHIRNQGKWERQGTLRREISVVSVSAIGANHVHLISLGVSAA